MAKKKFEEAILTISVRYDSSITDAEAVASAMDTLLETALSTAGVLDEVGNPSPGSFYVIADKRPQLRHEPLVLTASTDDDEVRAILHFGGDGLAGKYDPENPRDVPLMRFNALRKYHDYIDERAFAKLCEPQGPDWLDNTHYGIRGTDVLTRIRADAPMAVLDRAARWCRDLIQPAARHFLAHSVKDIMGMIAAASDLHPQFNEPRVTSGTY